MNIQKELLGLELGPEVGRYLSFYTFTHKKEPNQKMQGHGGLRQLLFDKFMSINEKLAAHLSKWPRKASILEWMITGKITLTRKHSLLWSNNVST